MLLIGCAQVTILAEKLHQHEIKGVLFKVIKQNGLSLTVEHNADDDRTAKALVKEFVGSLPEIKNFYVNVQMIDESGRIL
jgi:hypothetical protein